MKILKISLIIFTIILALNGLLKFMDYICNSSIFGPVLMFLVGLIIFGLVGLVLYVELLKKIEHEEVD